VLLLLRVGKRLRPRREWNQIALKAKVPISKHQTPNSKPANPVTFEILGFWSLEFGYWSFSFCALQKERVCGGNGARGKRCDIDGAKRRPKAENRGFESIEVRAQATSLRVSFTLRHGTRPRREWSRRESSDIDLSPVRGELSGESESIEVRVRHPSSESHTG
jgi:hypothetical protein